MNLHTTSFFNSTEVNISSRMNEYLKKNFGYEVEGDFDTLQEAKTSLQAEQLELKDQYMSAKYVENMLMIETITALLKVHGETLKEDEELLPFVEGKLAKQWASTHSVTVGDIELIPNDETEVHAIMKDGNKIGDFVLDEMGWNWIVNWTDKEKAASNGQGVFSSIDDMIDSIMNNSQSESIKEEDEEEKGKKKLNAVQEDKYSDLNPTNKFGYFGGPGFYSNDGSTYTEPHYDDFDIRQHNKDNPEDKIKLNNWDDFNLKMRYHKKDGKRVQGYGGMGYNVSFHGNPKDVEAFAMKNLDAERYSGDNIPEAVQMKAVNEDDEEKGPEHYRYVNDSQLSRVQDRLRLTISDLDHAIQYRAKNSHLFFNTGDKAGTGDLYGIKEKLEKIDDEWDDQTELYGM